MRRCILILAGVALLGCDGGDTIEPRDRVIEAGTYSYEGYWLHPGTLEWDTIRGTLALDIVTPDSVHGQWVISGFRTDSVGGYWNENAYVVQARSPNDRVRVTNRVWRVGSAAELSCSLAYWEMVTQTDTARTGGGCELLKQP